MSTEIRVTTEQESRAVAEQARQTEWEGRAFIRELYLGGSVGVSANVFRVSGPRSHSLAWKSSSTVGTGENEFTSSQSRATAMRRAILKFPAPFAWSGLLHIALRAVYNLRWAGRR